MGTTPFPYLNRATCVSGAGGFFDKLPPRGPFFRSPLTFEHFPNSNLVFHHGTFANMITFIRNMEFDLQIERFASASAKIDKLMFGYVLATSKAVMCSLTQLRLLTCNGIGIILRNQNGFKAFRCGDSGEYDECIKKAKTSTAILRQHMTRL
ncbi:hypothetical protein E2542_SST28363 [Spatholobus suberectus]|nr:hypothetical protein E2542_SST28363 [Spatholobus suberectus]